MTLLGQHATVAPVCQTVRLCSHHVPTPAGRTTAADLPYTPCTWVFSFFWVLRQQALTWAPVPLNLDAQSFWLISSVCVRGGIGVTTDRGGSEAAAPQHSDRDGHICGPTHPKPAAGDSPTGEGHPV